MQLSLNEIHTDSFISELSKSLCDSYPFMDRNLLERNLNSTMSSYKVYRQNTVELKQDVNSKINMFLNARKLEGLSPKTIYMYEKQLQMFEKFINKSIINITVNDIREYLGQLSNYKQSTINTKLHILQSFFSWLQEEEIIDKNPTKKIKKSKKEKRLPKALSLQELIILRESCETLRERALIETLYATGCRLSELVSLNKDDIDYNKMCANIIGKGDKERKIFFSEIALYHIKKYLKSREDNCDALIITERKYKDKKGDKKHHRLGNRAIQKEVNKIAKRIGIEKKLTCHILRHTFATLSLNNGADISIIQKWLGHSSISTTEVYAILDDNKKNEQYRKYFIQ